MNCDSAQRTDSELAALTLAGRKDCFSEIVKRHKAPIFRLIRGYVGDPEEALDLVQDCFVSAFKRLDSYDQARPFRAWLARIAINKCRDWARRRAVRGLLFSSADADERLVPDSRPTTDRSLADREELRLLWSAIRDLPRALKEPLILCAIDNLSQAEAAAVLRISEKAVETRIYRARKRLAAIRDG
ncbi:RNA polymerase sigma factor [Allosphingosinicella vermicomposti]|uniref:RNA polymerase sigma factor n=1 Tax=Allosphingosinicella vermicomposti TaxID=614671 RepID=UPI000D103642|nr:RNA polymerase sigma factor [Allosphingosinicella vermicomposti]